MCGDPVDVTHAGMHALKTLNHILLERFEMPLNEVKTFACDRCSMKARDAAGKVNRDHADEMAAIIRDLKECVDPPSEKEMLERLAELNHPDIPGLLHAIGERKAESKTKGKGR